MAMEVKLDGVTLELVQGDITKQEGFDAVVNAANAQLQPGGGVAGAIHRAAGPELAEECKKYAPIQPGQAVITGAYKLPNRYVVHCLGPRYGLDEPSDKLLADCYRNALKVADEHRAESIAFPAISTGAFGYPMEEAARIAFRTIQEVAPTLKNVKRVRFVLYRREDLEIHERVLRELLEGTQTQS
jgi:O-acetyl-ADP-ribose deacetylase (regulator of RNase III)